MSMPKLNNANIHDVLRFENLSGQNHSPTVHHVCVSLFALSYLQRPIFPTSRLEYSGEAVTYWIENQFPRTSRAQCLIIIGPTGTGKTSFATSLPGDYNYFQVRFNLDRWNDNARYSVYDDIPWDEFEKRNFPDKRSLLTQQSKPIQVRAVLNEQIDLHCTTVLLYCITDDG